MMDSIGDGTRGIICDQCESLTTTGSKFKSLTAEGENSNGAAIAVKNSCKITIDNSTTFEDLEAKKGPAIYAWNAEVAIAGNFNNLRQMYPFNDATQLSDNEFL